MNYDDARLSLVAARKRAGLSMAQVGRRLGMSRQAVNGWEKGRNTPSAEDFMRWAAAVGHQVEVAPQVDLDDLTDLVALGRAVGADGVATLEDLARVILSGDDRMARIAAGYIRALLAEVDAQDRLKRA